MQTIIDWLNQFLNQIMVWVTYLLPDSPFKGLISSLDNQYLRWLNWMFDFGTCCTILTAWGAAIAIFYLYRVIMKWVGMIGE